MISSAANLWNRMVGHNPLTHSNKVDVNSTGTTTETSDSNNQNAINNLAGRSFPSVVSATPGLDNTIVPIPTAFPLKTAESEIPGLYDRIIPPPSVPPECEIPGLYDRIIPPSSAPPSYEQIALPSYEQVGPPSYEEVGPPSYEEVSIEDPSYQPDPKASLSDVAVEPEVIGEGLAASQSANSGRLSRTYKLAKIYIKTSDTAAKITKNTSKAIAQFAIACSSTSVKAWSLGPIGCVAVLTYKAAGIDHYTNAGKVLINSLKGNVPSKQNPDQRMGISEALGEATGHVCKGLGTAAISGAYAVGTLSNVIGYVPNESVSLHNAANTLAYGVNSAANITLSTGFQLVNTLTESAASNPIATVNNAWTATCLGVMALGMGAGLYGAAKSYVNAADTDSYLSKVKHNTIMTASLISTVAIPCLMGSHLLS